MCNTVNRLIYSNFKIRLKQYYIFLPRKELELISSDILPIRNSLTASSSIEIFQRSP